MEKVFSYGTLSDPEIQTRLLGRELAGNQDAVKGFRLEEIEIDQQIYWILVPDKHTKQIVGGRVFEITKAELLIFDDYEGLNYQRSLVNLNSGFSAWVYHA